MPPKKSGLFTSQQSSSKKRNKRPNTKSQQPVEKPAWDIDYFEEDIVRFIKRKSGHFNQYATVIDTFDDLEPGEHKHRPHEIRIALLSGKEIKTHKKFVELVDRSFCHGDVVRRCGPPSGGEAAGATPSNYTAMRGTIQDVELHLDVEFLFNKKEPISNINSKLLRHLHLFSIGNFMMYDLPELNQQWLAKIDDVLFDVVLKFVDGSMCMIKRVDEGLFNLLATQDDSCPLFPGQVFCFDTAETQKLLRNARFFRGAYTPNLSEGLVINVIPSEMDADFVASKEQYSYPPQDIDLNHCRPFTHFKYTNWTIADVGIIPDYIRELSEEQRERGEIPDNILQEELKKDHIRNTGTHYDVLTVNPPQALVRNKLPEDYILTDFSRNMVRVCSTRTTVTVLWQDGTTEKVRSVDVCSLKHVDAKDFFLSDVVRTAGPDETGKKYYGVVMKVDPIQKTAQVKMLSPEKRNQIETYPIFDLEEYEELTHSIGDVVTLLQREDENPNHWVGEIIAIEADELKVRFSDQQVGYKKMDDVVNAGTLVFEPVDERSDSGSEDSHTDYMELANELMDMMDPLGSDVVYSAFDNEDVLEYIPPSEETATSAPAETASTPKDSSASMPHYEPPSARVAAPPRFQMIKSIEDHRLARDASTATPPSKFVKAVQKEWRNLEANLPTNVWVQASEENLYLMRACIAGANHTPYYKTLHVFDILLPETYPADAPKVLSHSYGYKINPNLYENGDICLSLLGTWQGKYEHEQWIPNQSSIYQLLVSISGLVLNASPYFNEAGYETSRGTEEAEENSRQYNEAVVIATLSHQTALFNRPPKNVVHIVQYFLQENVKFIVNHLDELLDKKEKALKLRNLTLQPSQGFLTSLKNRIPAYKSSMGKHVHMEEK